MANHKSAIKRHKQSLQRAARNRAMRSRMKNAVKEVRAAVLAKDTDRAAQALTAAQSVIGKAAGKGTVHWKNAARKVSRLSKAVAGVAA